MGHLVVRENAADDPLDAMTIAQLVSWLGGMRRGESPGARLAEDNPIFIGILSPGEKGGEQVAPTPEIGGVRFVATLDERRLGPWRDDPLTQPVRAPPPPLRRRIPKQ